MIRKAVVLLTLFMAISGCLWSQERPKGAYLGQSPPGMEPKIFAPGIISTGESEGCSAFSPDGNLCLFKRYGESYPDIYMMEQIAGRWTPPRLVPFQGKYKAADFTFAPVGKVLYFTYYRTPGSGAATRGGNIWKVERTETGWSGPVPLGPVINTGAHDSYPSLTKDGTLYFFSNRAGGEGLNDIYRARLIDGQYTKAENLGKQINTGAEEWDPYIAPDESYLIFCSTKPGGYGGDDLYITFRNRDGSWAAPVHMGKKINSPASENRPYVTPDGKYFIYTSTGKNPGSRGKRDIYWVDAGFIQTFKANDYFGREPPGLEPEIFAPGIISTGKHEGCFSFSRDGRLFIFARSGVIFIMEQKDGTWGSPKRAPFGMPSYDGDFLLAPDGKTLYLASNRPVTKEGPPPGYANIWEVKRTATGWSEPRHLQPPVNVNRHSSYPCLTAGRTLYFFSKHRKDSFGKGDIYRAPLSNGKYTRVENLGETINTAYEEVDPFIAADESYLIFSSNRPGGYGKDDLYISFRKNNGPGSWTEPINMGKEINSSTNEWMPYVTPDGKYFFFTTRKRAHLPPGIKKTIADPPGNGSRDIYWVSAGIIEKFKE